MGWKAPAIHSANVGGVTMITSLPTGDALVVKVGEEEECGCWPPTAAQVWRL